MIYSDLSELISQEKSGREYFYSLPVSVQKEIRHYSAVIHSTNDLHILARNVEQRIREDILSLRG